ncbi:MAG TPA: hypothetical protein VH255_08635 [Verrucomicrobiae bacterium]|nr:hypothetical protein [Verrucomicrobiae bacterium]
MKTKIIGLIITVTMVAFIACPLLVKAEDKPAIKQQYEYAILKYDGPDRMQIFYPNKFETYHLFQKGVTLPKDAHDEEFCVNYVVNDLAKDGWEPIQLHATRVMLRRSLAR